MILKKQNAPNVKKNFLLLVVNKFLIILFLLQMSVDTMAQSENDVLPTISVRKNKKIEKKIEEAIETSSFF